MELLRTFYRLLVVTRRRHGLPPQPFAWFRNLAECLGEAMTVRIASHRGQPVASIVTLRHASTMVYKYGASDARAHPLGAVHSLFWKAIQDASVGGCVSLDLGRTDLHDSGLSTFKERWGAQGAPLRYWRSPVPVQASRAAREGIARRGSTPCAAFLANRDGQGSLQTLWVMIGVVATPSELETVREFFELFKTHWEPAEPGQRYQVILSTGGCTDQFQADAHLAYGAAEQPWDEQAGVDIERLDGPTEITWRGSRLPIYTRLAAFDDASEGIALTFRLKRVTYCRRSGNRVVYRIGYDLFREISYLLTVGQPVQWASTPTLELHIEVLRNLLLDSGIAFVEIPPRPLDHDFVCCLTHDVDFYGIRRHAFDRTLAGFIARASAGTAADLLRGRRRASEALRNWTALLSLPFVFLNRVRDLWRPFDDYARAENGLPSTFFLIPFRQRPGVAPDGTTNPVRAVAYQVSDIAEDVKDAAARGSEIAVHGIDSWHDAGCGRAEMAQVASVIGRRPNGIRMHWLYFSDRSAATARERRVRVRLHVWLQRRRGLSCGNVAGFSSAGC